MSRMQLDEQAVSFMIKRSAEYRALAQTDLGKAPSSAHIGDPPFVAYLAGELQRALDVLGGSVVRLAVVTVPKVGERKARGKLPTQKTRRKSQPLKCVVRPDDWTTSSGVGPRHQSKVVSGGVSTWPESTGSKCVATVFT